jgi:hypothetical protein
MIALLIEQSGLVLQSIAAIAIVWLIYVAFKLHDRQFNRRSGEPPLVSGIIPFLGVALEYGKDPKKMLTEAQSKYGDCFTLYIAGKRMTFVLDPLTIPNVYKKFKTFDFHPIARDITEAAFFTPRDKQALYEKEVLKQYARHLNGDGLVKLTTNFQKQLLDSRHKNKGPLIGA